jgi:hypothetical protein
MRTVIQNLGAERRIQHMSAEFGMEVDLEDRAPAQLPPFLLILIFAPLNY